jgi:hypothetical protein
MPNDQLKMLSDEEIDVYEEAKKPKGPYAEYGNKTVVDDDFIISIIEELATLRRNIKV